MIPVGAGLAPARIGRIHAFIGGHNDVAFAQIRVWVNHTPTKDKHEIRSQNTQSQVYTLKGL